MKVFKYIFNSLILILLTSYIFCLILSAINLNNNEKIWSELNYNTIINNQTEYESLRYGLGNIADNGCGAIACYNIFVLENKYKPLPEIISYFDRSNQNLYGILGTNPFAISRYMSAEGYNSSVYFNSSRFIEVAENSKYSILMFFNFSGGHFQLLTDYDGETFQLYNPTLRMSMENLLEKTNDCVRILITVN